MAHYEHFVCGPLENNVFVLTDEATGSCAVIDPGIDCDAIHGYIERRGLKVSLILLTHGHFDHAHGAAVFAARYNAPVALHPADQEWLDRMAEICSSWNMPEPVGQPEAGVALSHGQVLELGETRIEVRHTPGHSAGQVAFIVPGTAFVGDTLFWRAVGRYDLPGSDYDALVRSITDQLYTLPDETVVWPGHGQSTTVGEERRLNPYVGESARFKRLD